MTKLTTLATITSGYLSNEQIQSNFESISTAFQNTLSRDGSTPNFLTSNLDLNLKKITNLGMPLNNTDAASKAYVDQVAFDGEITINTSDSDIIATGTSTARSLADRAQELYNVKDYGALGDGSTNDTAAINLAILSCFNAGGGIVWFPAGTYMASQIIVYRYVILDGANPISTTLKQIAGTNSTFIISEHFADLTASGLYAPTTLTVPSFYGLKDIIIDGNKDNQSAGDGINFYGNALIFKGTVIVKDCYHDNIYTEGASGATLTGILGYESGIIDNLISVRAGRYGWNFAGCHNTQVDRYTCILDDTGDYGLYVSNQTNATAVLDEIGYVHIYGTSTNTTNRKGVYLGGGAVTIGTINADSVSVVIDAPSPDTGRPIIQTLKMTGIGKAATNNIGLQVNATQICIGHIYGSTNSAATGATCVEWNATNGQVNSLFLYDNSTGTNKGLDNNSSVCAFYNVNISQFTGAGSVAIETGGNYNMINGRLVNNKNGVAYTAGGQNSLSLEINYSTGQTAVSGSTPGTSDRFDINTSGLAATRTKCSVTTSSGAANQIALDSTAVQTITITHNSLYTPVARNVQLTTATTLTDHVWDLTPYFVSASSTTLTVKCKLGTASSTGGAKADVIARINIGM